MDIISILIWIIVILISFFVVKWLIQGYNKFAKQWQVLKKYWSNVLTEYQRRADLFYNFSEMLKSYTQFESTTMTQVIKARSGNFGATLEEQQTAIGELDQNFPKILSKLMALSERYPKLKAVEEYSNFSDEIRITENRINESRISYNEIVQEFNIMTKTFPNSIIAWIFRFEEQEYFTNQKEDYLLKLNS